MHGDAAGAENARQARDRDGMELLRFRREAPTPCLDGLGFTPTMGCASALDVRVLSDKELDAPVTEGEGTGYARGRRTVGQA